MLIAFRKEEKGFSLIEMVVALAALMILTLVVVPGFESVMKSFQVRNAGEALLNGLQVARGEAISRNQNVEFILSGTKTAWQVNIPNLSTVVDSRASTEGSSDVVRTNVPSAATKITFNSLGGVVANADGSATLTQIDVSATGSDRNLRINIDPAGGRPKLCNPQKATGPTAC